MEGPKLSLESPSSHDVFLSATGRDIEQISAVSFYIQCLRNEMPNVGTPCQNPPAMSEKIVHSSHGFTAKVGRVVQQKAALG